MPYQQKSRTEAGTNRTLFEQMEMSKRKKQWLIVLVATVAIGCELLIFAGLIRMTLNALDDGPAHRPSEFSKGR